VTIPGVPSVAVVGAFRSGTNYLQYLLETNFRCRVVPNAHGWKHAPVAISLRRSRRIWDGRVPIIAVMKPPLAFLQSVFRYHLEVGRNIAAPKEWSAFLEAPFSIFNGRRGRTPELSFANPVEYWNCLYLNLTTLPEPAFRCRLIRYDRLTDAPEQQVEDLAKFAGLRRRSGPFRLPEGPLRRGPRAWTRRITGRSTEVAPNPGEAARNRMPLPEFTETQRQSVLARVHPDLAALAGISAQGAVA